MQEQFGYPALSDTAKAKILGENAAALYEIDLGLATTIATSSRECCHRPVASWPLSSRELTRGSPGGAETRGGLLADAGQRRNGMVTYAPGVSGDRSLRPCRRAVAVAERLAGVAGQARQQGAEL